MKLQLTDPIAFFDLETTGVDVATDRVVEISILRIEPSGNRKIDTKRLNPTVPIPEEASSIHGIYDVDVKDKPTFADVAAEVKEILEGCDLAGYNSNKFDIPLLAEEFLRAGLDPKLENRRMIDVQAVFHKMEKRDLSAAYRFYCEKELEGAHGAEADILATYEVLEAQIERYTEIENDMDFLHEFSIRQQEKVDLAGRVVKDDRGVEVFNFGKHKGKPVEEVFQDQPGYYSWMMKSDFPLYTKKVITDIRNRIQG